MNPMNYQQTVDYLYEQLPMFSKQGKDAIKKDLTNTIKICEALGDPQNKYKTIHIAGTNGKGSTSHMLSAILQQAGYKTGLYTSPHLIDFRERIRINGVPVEEEFVTNFVNSNHALIEEVEPSFFEITVAMAFDAFAYHEVDIAIIETGLGGRLDSTNVIKPILSVITNISYDHTDILGKTLPEIAFEKAGIIKQQTPVVIGEQQEETERVFFEQAIHKQSTIYYADAMWDMVKTGQDTSHQFYKAVNRAQREMYDIACDMQGNYQKHNLKCTLAAVEVLRSGLDLNITKDDITRALYNVKKISGLHGRWDVLQQQPLIVADVAHNSAGIKEVLNQWQQINAVRKHIILGFVKDKEVEDILSLFPKDAVYYFCNAQIPRALPAENLKTIAKNFGLEGNVHGSVAEAVAAARHALGKDDALLITGSFFIVGEAIEYLNVNNGLLFATSLE